MSRKLHYVVAAILIVALISLVMVGCGPEGGDTGEEKPVKAAVIWSITDPPRAGGWDRAQHAGYSVLTDEFGWDLSIAEGVPYGDCAKIAADYADRGYDIVIFPDNGMLDAWKEVAPEYPETWFMMMSNYDVLPESDKVAVWDPDMYSYGVTVGAIMASVSETGVVGVIGGVPITGLELQFSGVIEGAKAVDPDIQVEVAFVGDWDNVANHSELTKVLMDKGADVFFTVTGPAAKGVYEAAESGGAYSIGYAADFYDDAPGTIMTSVLADIKPAYRELAKAYEEGSLSRKESIIGAENFSVGDFRGAISAELEAEIKQLLEDIQSGKIAVPHKIHKMM